MEGIFRAEGLPLTVQRRVVLEVMLARKDHPTADDVFEEVKARQPEVARATVYRTLEKLVELGMLRKVCHPGSSVRYDPRTERHHHLVCLSCDKMIDLNAPALNRIPLPNTRAQGFHISDYSIQFRGLCEECRTRQRGRASGQKKGKRRSRRGT